MNTHKLKSELSHFTGSESYYRVMPRLSITDGIRYLADKTNSYWLVTAIYSHLVTQSIHSEFVVAKLTVSGEIADLVLDDGNDQVISRQRIDYTDFPLDEISIYCCYQQQDWILLLPSEY